MIQEHPGINLPGKPVLCVTVKQPNSHLLSSTQTAAQGPEGKASLLSRDSFHFWGLTQLKFHKAESRKDAGLVNHLHIKAIENHIPPVLLIPQKTPDESHRMSFHHIAVGRSTKLLPTSAVYKISSSSCCTLPLLSSPQVYSSSLLLLNSLLPMKNHQSRKWHRSVM